MAEGQVEVRASEATGPEGEAAHLHPTVPGGSGGSRRKHITSPEEEHTSSSHEDETAGSVGGLSGGKGIRREQMLSDRQTLS